MRSFTRAVGILVLLAGAGCGSSTIAPVASGPPGKMEKTMANCPSAVAGAMSTVRAIDGGVVVDVTAPDLDGQRAVVERARKHATMGAPDARRGLHTGRHGGPGDTGHCPIIHLGTTVEVVEIAGGARITVMAVDPAAAAALQRDTRERVQWYAPTAAR